MHSARSKDDEEEFDENYDAFEAFLERYESDLEHRKEKSAAFWFLISSSFSFFF